MQRGGPDKSFLEGGGATGVRLRGLDWASHPLGPPEMWPQTLKDAVRTLLISRQPLWIGWGPSLAFFCNDACSSLLDVKKERSVGAPAREIWGESWPELVAVAESVAAKRADGAASAPIVVERPDARPETHLRLSFRPLQDDLGATHGVVCAVEDASEHVIAERRLSLLAELASDFSGAETQQAVFALLQKRLGAQASELSFALVYFVESKGRAHLVSASGLRPGHAFAPTDFDISAADAIWHADFPERTPEEAGSTLVARVQDLPARDGVSKAVVVPLRGNDSWFLVAGVAPRARFDEKYRKFITLVASQVSCGLSAVRSSVERADRASAESALRDREQRYRLVSEAAHDFIWDWNLVTNEVVRNEGMQRLFGYGPDEIPRDRTWGPSNIHPADRDRVIASMQEAIDGSTAFWEDEYRFRRADGSFADVSARAQIVRDQTGRAVRMVGSMRDLTHRKQAENALRESEDRLRTLVSLMPAGVYACDREGRITFYNRQAVELWGAEPHLRDRFWVGREFTMPDGAKLSPDRTPLASSLRSGSSFREVEAVIEKADGTKIHAAMSIDPVRDAQGAVVGAICVFHDVSERKNQERAQAMLAAIVHSSDDAIIGKDLDGTIKSWNGGAERIFGYAPNEVIGRSIKLVIPPDRWEEERQILARLRAGEHINHFKTVRLHRDKHPIHVSLTISPLRDDHGNVVGASSIMRDVTEQIRAEEMLAESERKYRQLLESLPAAVYTCDANGHITLFNDAAVTLWGRQPELGTALWCGSWKIYRTDGTPVPLDECPMAITLKTGRSVRGQEIVVERPDGERRHVLPHPEPLFDGTGRVVGAVNMLVDITDLKRAEAELAATKDDLAQEVVALTRLHELAVQLTAVRALKPSLGLVLETAMHLQGADIGEISLYDTRTQSLHCEVSAGPGSSDLALSVASEASGDLCAAAFASKQRYAVEDIEKSQAGEQLRAAMRAAGLRAMHCTPIVTRSGEPVGVLSLFFRTPTSVSQRERKFADICARFAAETVDAERSTQALRESERLYRAIGESIEYGIWVCDADGRNTYASDSFLRLVGLTQEQCSTFGWAGVLHPEDADRTLAAWQKCASGGGVWDFEHRFRGVDGKWHPVLARGVPVRNERGEITAWVGINLDIERLKAVEDQLRNLNERLEQRVAERTAELEEANAKFQAMFDQGLFAGLLALDGTLLDVNRSSIEQYGYAREDVVGKLFWDTGWWNRSAAVQAWLKTGFDQAVRGTAFHGESICFTADGNERIIDFALMPIKDAHGKVSFVVPTGLDITDRKLAEQERRTAEILRESESRFRTMANSAPTLIWMSDADKRYTWFNRPWLDFTGRPMDEEIGYGWANGLHPDDRARSIALYESSFEAREEFRSEYRLQRHDGVYRWFMNHGVPLYGSAGEFKGYIGSSVDVTEQVLARQTLESQHTLLEEAVRARTEELKESHQKLRLAERMASLGTLSAGLGHDMGNLLVPLRVRLQSLSEAGLPERLQEDVEVIRSSADYLQRLANGLRMLAIDPSRDKPREATELSSWWLDASPMLKTVLRRGMRLDSRVPASPSHACISRAALTQAVFNLVQNAADALRSSTRGTITVWVEADENEIRVGVSDDGPGMSEETKRRCMEPFYTTKTRAISTGLGLALVYGLVQEAGGTVTIDSEPGEGATFTLHLPRARVRAPEVHGQGRPHLAVVDLTDKRLQAFAVAELKQLSYNVELGDARLSEADLLVVEEIRNPAGLGPHAKVVLLGSGPVDLNGRISVMLEKKPRPNELRDVLRRVVGQQQAAEANEC